jgi:hypothetical protein
MAKIYIAAKTSRRKQMAEIGRSLEAAGHTITSSWIFADDHALDRSTIAKRDMEHCAAADTIVLFTEPRNRRQREHGGRFCEFGMMLAWLAVGWPKTPIIVGEPENVFCELPCVIQVADVDSLIAYLTEHNNTNLPAIVEKGAAAV